jgi:hypothetical protein
MRCPDRGRDGNDGGRGDGNPPIFLAFPVETAGRQLPRLTVRGGQALRLRPGAAAGFLLKANCSAQRWEGGRIAIAALMNSLDMVCEIAHVLWMFRFEC